MCYNSTLGDRCLKSTCLLLGSELCRDKGHISPEDGGQRIEALVLSAKRKHKVPWQRGSTAWVSEVLWGGESQGSSKSKWELVRPEAEGRVAALEAQQIADAQGRRQRPLWEGCEDHSEQEYMARDEC